MRYRFREKRETRKEKIEVRGDAVRHLPACPVPFPHFSNSDSVFSLFRFLSSLYFLFSRFSFLVSLFSQFKQSGIKPHRSLDLAEQVVFIGRVDVSRRWAGSEHHWKQPGRCIYAGFGAAGLDAMGKRHACVRLRLHRHGYHRAVERSAVAWTGAYLA